MLNYFQMKISETLNGIQIERRQVYLHIIRRIILSASTKKKKKKKRRNHRKLRLDTNTNHQTQAIKKGKDRK